MATGTALVEKTDSFEKSNSKSQDYYKLRTFSQVTHIIRKITPENIDNVYSKLKKRLITTSIQTLEEIVYWIYEEAISFPLTENDGNKSINRMHPIAKLCKLCADIEVSASDAYAVQVITFQEILNKVILSDYERMSKQPSCEKKLLNWLKNFKGSEDKKLEWIHTNCIKMEKNENNRALGSINFVMELFILDIINLKTLYKIVEFTIMKASLTSVIECLHKVLSFIKIDFKVLKWADDTKYELLSGVLEKMSELLQDSSTSQCTKNMIKDLVGIWPKEEVKEFVDKNEGEIQALNPLGDVMFNRTENPWQPRRIAVNFLTDEENQFEEFLNDVRGILNKLTIGENFKLIKRFRNLPVNSEEKFEQVANIIFEKAIEEPIFSATYAKLCKMLCKLEVLNRQGEKIDFRILLVNKCETEFWKRANQNSGNWKLDKDYKLQSGIQFGENKKIRYVGNIRFISELFNVGVIVAEIIHICIKVFLDNPDELSLDCLCLLLTTSGKQLECNNESILALHRQMPRWDTILRVPYTPLNSCFQRLTELLQKKEHSLHISSKVRFMLQDVIELRHNKWIPKERMKQSNRKLYSSTLLS